MNPTEQELADQLVTALQYITRLEKELEVAYAALGRKVVKDNGRSD